MPLSAKKKLKLKRQKREEYVRSCSYSGRAVMPFGDTHWDAAAAKYIETGNEELKHEFPGPRR
jgi:hypothetical protein